VISQGISHDGELIFQTKGDTDRVPDQKWSGRCRSAVRDGIRFAISAI